MYNLKPNTRKHTFVSNLPLVQNPEPAKYFRKERKKETPNNNAILKTHDMS